MRILNKKSSILFFGLCLAYSTFTHAQNDYENKLEATNEEGISTENQTNPQVKINQDPRIKRLLNIKSSMAKEGEFSDRYKIQLYYGNLNKANSILKAADESFSKWEPSIQWETPNYKVWIGNYRSRLEADRALKEIHEKFPNAFIFKPEKK
ncbi:SPOR domain-containing protein [Aquimarina sp. TRL1]|uniref:SPOR domain-containing protein n=1 Tax=Aquimarina sp. (strain TRL1) TaxID=2736252 RepID=UPI001588BDD3|nr:SPOR domain-containing protein [Aquimarina sp. TRL1]QKX05140.1 SPOR domain-containing protein [Aquimarina sp. TRL1]